jgi:hypothetical protein
MPAHTAVVQETIAALVASHGDMRHSIDPQPWRLTAADAAIEQIDLRRHLREYRIECLVEKFETRHFGVPQIDSTLLRSAASTRA